MVPLPSVGRRYVQHRRVGLGDVDPTGRLRLDAVVGYLQDIATADAHDAEIGDVYAWIVRRTSIRLADGARWPAVGEHLDITTFCGGFASRWAERRTSVSGPGGSVEGASIWVAIDVSGRPQRLPVRFHEVFAEAAGGREVSARLKHDDMPSTALSRPWALRRTDLDTLGHVNNAAHWQTVEEALEGRAPRAATVEFRAALEWPGPAELLVDDSCADNGLLRTWLCAQQTVRSSAVVHLL